MSNIQRLIWVIMNLFNLLDIKGTLRKTFFVLGMCFLIVGQLEAASNVDLYIEREIVKYNASQQEQDEAIRQAFSRLIVRVTGIEQSLDNAEIQEALKNGSRYLATFRFEASDEFFTNVLGEQVQTKAMTMEFDRASVDSLLVQNRLPVWGSKRPDVLIWLADRIEGQDHILSDTEVTGISGYLEDQARRRGIPYMLPIMDLTDSLSLSFSEVYGLFSQDIEEASLRYEPEAVLAGRISQSGNDYKADWLMLFKGERIRLPTVTGNEEFIISQGIDLVAQRLSAQYALVLDPLLFGTISVQVLDIKNAVEFAALEDYLKSINLITKVTVSVFEENNITFEVEISGDRAQLVDVLSLDRQLIPVVEESLEAQLDNILVFQWNANN